METNRVLSMLNLQASRQLRNGQLEAAQRSVDEAIRYFEAACRRLQQEERLYHSQETTTELWKSQVQVSALLKMKLGKMQASMGAQKKDERLVASGKTVIAQSSRTLRGILLQPAAPQQKMQAPASDDKPTSSTDKKKTEDAHAPSYPSSSALTTTNNNYKFSSCGSETSSSCSSSFREHHQKAHMESLDAA